MMSAYWILSIFGFILLAQSLQAQVPQTDLFLFQLVRDDTSKWHVHSPQYLSAFNADGYTNQPEFISDDILYMSVRKRDAQQNDIYTLDLDAHSVMQVTETAESEFSPLLRPDGETFSCVRQVHGDSVDQQLFIYPLDRSDNGYGAFTALKTIGYHCWLTEERVALFLVGDPIRLAIANPRADSYQIYASNIGRSLRKTADGHLAYIHKYSDDYWYLKTLDPDSRRSEIVGESLKGQEDFVIGPEGEYFMGSGGVLYVLDPARNNTWTPVFDLGLFGVQKITRLALNDRLQLAVVSVRD